MVVEWLRSIMMVITTVPCTVACNCVVVLWSLNDTGQS